jgi:hypothetical protein
MRNFVLTITITICICIGIKKLYNLTFEPSTPQQYTLIEREPWQRQAIATKNNNWDFMPTTSVSKHTTSYPKVNYRFVTPSVKSATVKYNFTQPLKNTSFGTGSFGNGTSNFSSNRKLSRTSSNNVTSTGTLSSNITFRSKNTTNTRENSTTEESEELLAMVTPFSPMLAPPTVGDDYDGETPDIGVEDAVDDEGLDIESAPIGNATYMLPFILLYSLFLKRKTLKHIII